MTLYQRSIVYGIWIILIWIVFFNIHYFTLQNRQLENVDSMCNFSLKDWTLIKESPQFGTHDKTNRILDNQHQTAYVNSTIYSIKPSNLMTLPKLQFLPNLRNPCFYVQDPPKDDR